MLKMFNSLRHSLTSGQKEIGSIFFGIILFTFTALLYLIGTLSRRYTYVRITQNYYIPIFTAEHFSSVNFTDPQGRVTSQLEPEENYVVPKLVHYVWFGENEMFDFKHFLGVKSAFLNIKPERVLFHCDWKPIGPWWHHLQDLISLHQDSWHFEIVYRQAPKKIYDHEITRTRHKVDVMAIQILQEYGGIYLDLDVIALRSFDPLRRYNFTMGLEYWGSPGRLNNGVILARKKAEFLDLWLHSYRDFIKSEWDQHSAQVPYELQFRFPELIHVERESLNQPSGRNLELIYEQTFDWSGNYAIHLWEELHDLEHNPVSITRTNSTFGKIASLIYYGNS